MVYPVLVGLVLIAPWQGGHGYGAAAPPGAPAHPDDEDAVHRLAALGGSPKVTVKITVLAFVVATVAGVLISFLFVQSKRIETALFLTPCCCRSRPSWPWRRSSSSA